MKGPAQLMLTSDDLPRLEMYVNIIRSVLDPDHRLDQLLIMYGPRPLTNVHAHIKGLGRKFGFHAPSSTKVCKIGATTVRLQCGERDATLISRKLLHSIHTQTRHYESIVEPVHAASAFRTMEALRGRRKDEQVPEGKEVPENEQVPESDPVPESQQKRKK